MNKQALAEKVQEVLGGTKVESENVVAMVLDTIVSTVSAGEEVSLAGFGSFVPQARNARTARRNPPRFQRHGAPGQPRPTLYGQRGHQPIGHAWQRPN